MIGRMYGVWVGAETHSAAVCLLETTGAADSVTLLERLSITNTDQNTSENVAMKVQGVATTGTYTGTQTPRMLQLGDTIFGGTVKYNATIPPTVTSEPIYLESGFNVLSGFLWTPASDDEVICISPSDIMGFFLSVAGTGAILMSYGQTMREIGG